jgi:hypothetical protein
MLQLDIINMLSEVIGLLKRQNELLETLQPNQPQTKITVVGNKVQSNTKGLKNTEDFTL